VAYIEIIFNMGQLTTFMRAYIATTLFKWLGDFNFNINNTNRKILIYKYILFIITLYIYTYYNKLSLKTLG